MDFNNRLKKLRQERGLLQKDIAKVCSKKQEARSAWELGKTQPDIEDLIKIANIFDVSVDYLIGREGEDSTKTKITTEEYTLFNTLRGLNPKSKEIIIKLINHFKKLETS